MVRYAGRPRYVAGVDKLRTTQRASGGLDNRRSGRYRHAGTGQASAKEPPVLTRLRVKRVLPILAGVVAITAGTVVAATPATAVPATIPLKITNNSGRNEPVFIYDLGTLLATGQQGWADAGGTFHPWPGGAVPPIPAPDASIPGPANGQSV